MAEKREVVLSGKVVLGPSKFDLVLGLFDERPIPKSYKELKIKFIPNGAEKTFSISFFLHSVERITGEDNRTLNLKIRGLFFEDTLHPKFVPFPNYGYLEANYDPITRKGLIVFIKP